MFSGARLSSDVRQKTVTIESWMLTTPVQLPMQGVWDGEAFHNQQGTPLSACWNSVPFPCDISTFHQQLSICLRCGILLEYPLLRPIEFSTGPEVIPFCILLAYPSALQNIYVEFNITTNHVHVLSLKTAFKITLCCWYHRSKCPHVDMVLRRLCSTGFHTVSCKSQNAVTFTSPCAHISISCRHENLIMIIINIFRTKISSVTSRRRHDAILA